MANLARPIRPVPSNNKLAGSGISAAGPLRTVSRARILSGGSPGLLTGVSGSRKSVNVPAVGETKVSVVGLFHCRTVCEALVKTEPDKTAVKFCCPPSAGDVKVTPSVKVALLKFAPPAGPGVVARVPRLTNVEFAPGSPGGESVTLKDGVVEAKVMVVPEDVMVVPPPPMVQPAHPPAANVPVVLATKFIGSARAVIALILARANVNREPRRLFFTNFIRLILLHAYPSLTGNW